MGGVRNVSPAGETLTQLDEFLIVDPFCLVSSDDLLLFLQAP